MQHAKYNLPLHDYIYITYNQEASGVHAEGTIIIILIYLRTHVITIISP